MCVQKDVLGLDVLEFGHEHVFLGGFWDHVG